jgi:hypothetical protein
MNSSHKEIVAGSYVVLANTRTYEYRVYRLNDDDAGIVKSTWSRKSRKGLLSEKLNEYVLGTSTQLGQAVIGKKTRDIVEITNAEGERERYMIVWASDKAPSSDLALEELVVKQTGHMSVDQKYDKKMSAYQKHMKKKYGTT